MRPGRRAISASLLLPYLVSLSSAATELDHVANLADGGSGRQFALAFPEEILAGLLTTTDLPLAKPTASIGKRQKEPAPEAVVPDAKDTKIANKDAPVDGKDGRPHEGPFIETEAERGRKKAKASGDDELPSTGKKAAPKDSALSEGSNQALPESNDGVMDDPARVAPKEGTTGTEGGISEKNRERLGNLNSQGSLKTPEEPKEAPPLPHSEQEKLSVFEAKDKSKEKSKDKSKTASSKDSNADEKSDNDKDYDELELGGLKKPDDLPDKPHEIPHPLPNNGNKEDPLEIKPTSGSSKSASASSPEAAGIIQPLHSFVLSFTMILFSEIGDKTFLVAALMAMKHPPLLVFSAAFPALLVMTILSAVLGHAVPSLLPVKFTSFAAAVLFLIFGAKSLREGLAMKADEGIGEEMREVEMELDEKEQLAQKMGRRRSSMTPYMLESGRTGRKARTNSRLPAPPDSPPSSPDSRSPSPARGTNLTSMVAGFYNLFSFLLSPAWVQTFVMTFLGEWGDRSQIATIAMAAGQDYWWVTSGALVGHSICTAVAVIGGRAIAGRVSMRVVTLGGAFAFLVFGFVYLAEAFYYRDT